MGQSSSSLRNNVAVGNCHYQMNGSKESMQRATKPKRNPARFIMIALQQNEPQILPRPLFQRKPDQTPSIFRDLDIDWHCDATTGAGPVVEIQLILRDGQASGCRPGKLRAWLVNGSLSRKASPVSKLILNKTTKKNHSKGHMTYLIPHFNLQNHVDLFFFFFIEENASRLRSSPRCCSAGLRPRSMDWPRRKACSQPQCFWWFAFNPKSIFLYYSGGKM